MTDTQLIYNLRQNERFSARWDLLNREERRECLNSIREGADVKQTLFKRRKRCSESYELQPFAASFDFCFSD